MGVNNLPKTVTRQRRDCDLNPGPTAPESSTLATRLPSHRFYTVTMRVYRCRFCVSCVFPQLPWVNSIRCAHLMAALIMNACMHAVLSRELSYTVCVPFGRPRGLLGRPECWHTLSCQRPDPHNPCVRVRSYALFAQTTSVRGRHFTIQPHSYSPPTVRPWASAYRGKSGQLTPLEKWMKN